MKLTEELKTALRLATRDMVEEEIEERQKLIGMMVGTLYPEIVEDEIDELRLLIAERWGVRVSPNSNLVAICPPDCGGCSCPSGHPPCSHCVEHLVEV